MNEINTIPGYPGYKLERENDNFYIIGKTGRRLITHSNQDGYKLVCVSAPGTKNGNNTLYLHRAIALVYHLDTWFEGAVVDHIDRNCENNNLRWVTNSDNNNNNSMRGWKSIAGMLFFLLMQNSAPKS